MELQHIQYNINQGEGLNVEFKKATDELPANLFETVPCFFIFSARKNRLKIGRAEELGTGIRKIFKYSSLYSGDVPKVVEGDVFEVVVPLLTTTKTTSKTTSKTQVQILDYLRFKPRTTARELALLVGPFRRRRSLPH
jgi:predicted HTH transcriptional regulator